MKNLLLRFAVTSVLAASCISVFAQGKINMFNDSNHLLYFGTSIRAADAAFANQPIPITPLPSGVTLLVDLYGGADAGSMTLQQTTTVSTTSPGFFGPRNFTSPNLPGGQTATMQIKVRESNFATAEAAQAGGGYWGYSQVFTMKPSSTIAFNSMVSAGGTAQSTWIGGVEVGFGFAPTTPIIYSQPTSGTYVVGTNATLSVLAYSAAAIQYQWRKEGSPISGATNTSLTLTNLVLGDAGNYDVVASNIYGTAISSKAIVQVLPTNAPVIRINNILAVGTVSVPTPASLSITGGFSGGLIFYTVDGSVPTTSSTLYSGAFSMSNSATIRAMSLSADFSQTAEAPAITLVILPVYSLSTSVSGSGSILLNPGGGSYVSNTLVNLTAISSPNWAFNNWSGGLIGSSNPASITMNAAKSVQAVFVPSAYPLTLTTPGGGSVTANGSTIAANTYYPTSSIVSLLATPTSGWSFLRWQGTASSTANPFNLAMTQTQNVQAIFGTVVATNISGSGTVVMSVTNPVPFGTLLTNTAVPNPGNYFVSWTGALSGTNNPSTFTVNSATPVVGALFAPLVYQPSVTMQPTNQTVASGTATSFSVMATGTEPLSYQWHNGIGPIPDATNSTLFLNPTLTNHAGGYFAIVSNPYGQATSEVATLTVFIPATINSGPFSQVVAAHDTATFTVGAFGYPALSYQWLFNGVDIPGAHSSSLVITNVGTNNLGNYWLEAWNVYSAVTSTPAALLMSPSLQTPFAGLVAIRGREATLNISAQGSGSLSYQWYKDGQPVSGGTNATLIFPTLEFGDGGLYSVVVTSPYGSITNTPAQLVVNPANISLGLYAGITIEGVAGYTYGIEYTTDLQNTNSWQSLTNITLTQPVEIWVDTSANVLTNQKRFYRVTSH